MLSLIYLFKLADNAVIKFSVKMFVGIDSRETGKSSRKWWFGFASKMVSSIAMKSIDEITVK